MHLWNALQPVLMLLLRPWLSTGDVLWDSAIMVLLSCVLELLYSQGVANDKWLISWFIGHAPPLKTSIIVYEYVNSVHSDRFLALEWFMYQECKHTQMYCDFEVSNESIVPVTGSSVVVTFKGRCVKMTTGERCNDSRRHVYDMKLIKVAATKCNLAFVVGFIDHVLDQHTLYMQNNAWTEKIYNLKDGKWVGNSVATSKTFDNIILDPKIRKTLLLDLEDFKKGEEWYSMRGLPHRRGYIFYGAPGTGKTSVIKAISKHMKMSIYRMDFMQICDDADLDVAFKSIPKWSLIVFEDVDCGNFGAVVQSRALTSPTKGAKKLTISALLNCLDGLYELQSCIIVMTTNHFETLDPALIRPGRFDVHLHMPLVHRNEVCEFLAMFYGVDAAASCKDAIQENFKDNVLTPAQVTNICVVNKTDCRAAALAIIDSSL